MRNLPHTKGAHEWVFLSASVRSNTNLPRTERQSCNATVLGCEVVCWAEPYLLDSGIRLERKLSGSYYLLGWAIPQSCNCNHRRRRERYTLLCLGGLRPLVVLHSGQMDQNTCSLVHRLLARRHQSKARASSFLFCHPNRGPIVCRAAVCADRTV